MLTLLRGAQCYAPEKLGQCDLLIGGAQILALGERIDVAPVNTLVEEIDVSDYLIVPGLVDSLVHVTGGGGEGGFASRMPEMPASAALRAGITSFVGALGTDSVTRNLPNLLAKCRELQLAGLKAYCYSGSYHLPVKTLTGSVETDLLYIPEVLGVGEIAISDHRSSQPRWQELARLAAEVRVAGMLAGKAGIVSVHVGDGDGCLEPLWEVIRASDLPISQFYPTHINRNEALFAAGIAFAKAGGVIDLTTSTTPELLASGEVAIADALRRLRQAKVPWRQVTLSSDGYASLPHFDAHGELVSLEIAEPASLWQSVVQAVDSEGFALEDVLPLATTNPARVLKLKDAGRLQTGAPADMVLVNQRDLSIEAVMSDGQWRFGMQTIKA